MQPIFGRVVAESSAPPQDIGSPAEFLFMVHVDGSDHSAFRVTATDFKSNTFQAIKSRQQLEDLRDDTGIGGSWSEFVDYVVASLKSGDVKLIMDGTCYTKLIAQKAKGMPRISVSLGKLIDGAAGEAMANLSLELYKEFKDVQSSLAEEQANKYQLEKIVAAEKERNANLQKQIDLMLFSGKQKSQKRNDTENKDSASVMVSQDSPDNRTAHNPSSSKGPNRVVPVHRRSKVRGAVLDDTEDNS